MFAFNVDQEKVSHIPYMLKEWTREQGPRLWSARWSWTVPRARKGPGAATR